MRVPYDTSRFRPGCMYSIHSELREAPYTIRVLRGRTIVMIAQAKASLMATSYGVAEVEKKSEELMAERLEVVT